MEELTAYLDGYAAGVSDAPPCPPGLVVELVMRWIEGWRAGQRARRARAP